MTTRQGIPVSSRPFPGQAGAAHAGPGSLGHADPPVTRRHPATPSPAPLSRLVRLGFEIASLTPQVRPEGQAKLGEIVRELDEVIHDLRVLTAEGKPQPAPEPSSPRTARATHRVPTHLPSGPDYPAPA